MEGPLAMKSISMHLYPLVALGLIVAVILNGFFTSFSCHLQHVQPLSTTRQIVEVLASLG